MTSYSKDSDGHEYYVKKDGKEVYAQEHGSEIYAKKKDKKEFYAINEQGKPYYAKHKNSEFYASVKNGKNIFITDGNLQVYAKDASNAEIYPKQSDGREFVLTNNNIEYYAKDKHQMEIYPRDKHGDEFVVKNKYIKTKDGKNKLPILSTGRPKYKISGNKEVYPLDDQSKPYFCTNREGDEIYAKDENGNEYYPSEMYATDRLGNQYYAKDSADIIIYLRNNQGEYYIETNEGSFNTLKQFKGTVVYARQNTLEIYPTKYVNGKKSEVIFDVYAEEFNVGYYYPTDSNLNEYTNGEFIPIRGYPITADGYKIIPNANNEPQLYTIDTSVSADSIHKLLYRPDWRGYDFLTNVKSKRVGKNNLQEYKTLNLRMSTTSMLYYIITALIFVIVVLLSFL